MDSEPTNGKLFCVNQQHASTHQPTQHIQIYNVPSLSSVCLCPLGPVVSYSIFCHDGTLTFDLLTPRPNQFRVHLCSKMQ